MSAMDLPFALPGPGQDYWRLCNYLQFGAAITSTFGLQLPPFLLCNNHPELQHHVTEVKKWRQFDNHYRGAMISLTDQKKVLFATEKKDGVWNASWPILVPAPDEESAPIGETN